MKSLGIIVDKVDNGGLGKRLFEVLNKLHTQYDCYLFGNNIESLPAQNNFAILQQVHALSHKGALVATSLTSAQILKKCLTCTDKFYYMGGAEWMHLKNFRASQLQGIFWDDEIKVITRLERDFDLVSSLFRAPYCTINDWDPVEIEEKIL